MQRPFVIFSAVAASLSFYPASASDFFSTAVPEQPFSLGVRVGLNTSNRTVDKDVFNLWNSNSWGTGFDAGVVADINIRDYIAIQPGFFYQSRSGNFTYSDLLMPSENTQLQNTQFGHTRSYHFNIPILASLRFNVTDDVRWSVDFGPYLDFRLGSSETQKIMHISYNPADPGYVEAKKNTFDFGIKIGTGLNILHHYYVGVHYMAGALDVWKTPELGGRNKCWQFTVGYDF